MNSFFDKLKAVSSTESPYLHLLYKFALAIAGAVVVWLVLERILASFERRNRDKNLERSFEVILIERPVVLLRSGQVSFRW